jgi:hypothetical protein
MSPFSRAWFFDWTGREVVCENKVIEVEEQVSENENPLLGHRVALVMGKYQETGEPVTLKLQYEYVYLVLNLRGFEKLTFTLDSIPNISLLKMLKPPESSRRHYSIKSLNALKMPMAPVILLPLWIMIFTIKLPLCPTQEATFFY